MIQFGLREMTLFENSNHILLKMKAPVAAFHLDDWSDLTRHALGVGGMIGNSAV